MYCIMIRNYFKIALRNLLKNSVYSFINLFGLAVGLASSLLILLWVNDELTYDQFHQNKETIFQVYANSKGDGGEIITQRPLPLPLAEALTNERDIEWVAPTDWGGNHLLTVEENPLMKDGLYVGEDFLKIFSFHLLQGNEQTALKNANSIVLTRESAIALFGSEDVMGKIVRVDNQVDAYVTGIIENVPSNSTLQFDFLLPFSSYIESQEWVKRSLTNWGNNAFQIYVKLQDNASQTQVESRVRDLIKKNFEQSDFELILHPVTRWRLWSKFENGQPVGGGIEQVRMFSVIAIFILLIACINFMNLATARSEHRAREVGIRKSVGSKRTDLVFQFLGESTVMVFLSFLIAIGMAELLMPLYNHLIGKQLTINYTDSLFWTFSAIIVLGTGLLAGSYPAFYLSAFNAVSVLKGKLQSSQKGATPRKMLVILQFGLSIFLLAATLIFNKQVEFGREREIGYDQENLLMIENQGDIQRNFSVIKNELLTRGYATAVTQANSPITSIYAYMGDIGWEGKREDQRTSFATMATSYDYIKTTGIKLKAGRDFSEDFNDSLSMILNQAAVDYMGFENPIGATVTWNERNYKVIGVTENTLMASVFQPINPMMIIYDPSWFGYAMVRLPKGNVSEHLKNVEAVFRQYNPAYPFTYQFADQEYSKKFTRINLITQVSNVFAVLAIIISCLGLFGLAAYTAEQRTKEIGIRKVMGASVAGVVMLLSKEFARLVVVAFVIAAPLAWWAMENWLQSFPYHITVQWWMMAVAGLTALLLAIIIVGSQAWRAAMANPAKSLRSE
jgi:putative ABC transport system permease protein